VSAIGKAAIIFTHLYNAAVLNESEVTDMVKLPPLLGRILCWLGFHDYRVVDVTFEFGTDAVENSLWPNYEAYRERLSVSFGENRHSMQTKLNTFLLYRPDRYKEKR
jgi:hypothetical protein